MVVYKVDRLTRSLMDFARLVELFDIHGVSFVSVTQAFNTTNSMGRLTLNVLLSFAQFEREVIGERVRDKVAASRRKGLWTGGSVPLGYINQDKKLVVVPEEAETVRWIFRRYLELGGVSALLNELNCKGLTTKRRQLAGGTRGGGPFCKGGLNTLLKNRAYIGEVCYRDEIHPGCHEAILDRQTFEAVQARLKANLIPRKLKVRSPPFLLAGLLFDSAGNRMTPSHTVKNGARYRYYVSQALLQRRKNKAGQIARVAAAAIDTAVETFLRGTPGAPASQAASDLIKAYVSRITLLPTGLRLEFRALGSQVAEKGAGATPSRSVRAHIPWLHKPASSEKRFPRARRDGRTPRCEEVLAAIGKARNWLKELLTGSTFADIAGREGVVERRVRQLVVLAFVPPSRVRDLVESAVLAVTINQLAKAVSPMWPEALGRLGYGRRGRIEGFCRTMIVLGMGLESSALMKAAADSELLEAQAYLSRGLLFLTPRAAERQLLAENFGLPLFIFILALLRSAQGSLLERIAARIEDMDRPAPAPPVHFLSGRAVRASVSASGPSWPRSASPHCRASGHNPASWRRPGRSSAPSPGSPG